MARPRRCTGPAPGRGAVLRALGSGDLPQHLADDVDVGGNEYREETENPAYRLFLR